VKFTDGFWRNRPGISVYNACRVYNYQIDEKFITAFLPHFEVQNRGQTLTGPNLTLKLSSPLSGVIRVQVWHYQGGTDRGPAFELAAPPAPDVEIADGAGHVVLKSGALEARLSKGNAWDLSFFDDGRPLTNSRSKNLGYVVDRNGRAYMKDQLALGVGDCVYGLGERFTAFVKNGQVVESWNADGGTSSELAYKNVPFYLCSRGYGVFVNDPGRISFEVASEKVSRVCFSTPGEYLDYCVILGPHPKQVLERYTALTGRPALPPAWSFGLWLTTSFITDYDEATVTGFIDGMAERGIPLSVFHFDCFWMKEYHWCDFEWDKRWFPDPAGFLARLKKKGLKTCVWINPYIAQRSALFAEGKAGGFLLKKADGGVWQTDAWQPGLAMVDFTHPAARAWYASRLEALLDMGVDCFKTDFGEAIPHEGVAWHDGSDPLKMHNYYSYLYNKTVFALLEKKRGQGEAVVFARSGAAGSQRFPIHWGGDCTASYESMAETLRGGLSLCASGFGFWSHDISGFEQTAAPDLYKRWAAFGLLSTHSRLHGNSSYRVPWLFDEEAVDVVRFFTRLKCSLMPEIWAAACEAAARGVPVMRPMFLEFPDDPAAAFLDRQYLLGAHLLVAPVFSEAGEVTYYLPRSRWTDFFTNTESEGGRFVTETCAYLDIPLFVRGNSLIALGAVNDRPDYDYAGDVELRLYALDDGAEARATVSSQRGLPELEVTVQRSGDRYTIQSRGAKKPWSLRLVNCPAARSRDAAITVQPAGALIRPRAFSGACVVETGHEV
jgi:alpha-D-xyloside xylohydrolase